MEHTYIHHVGLCVEFELPCFTIILQIKDMYSRSSSSHFFQCSSVFVFYLFQWSIFGGRRTKVTTSQDCDKQKDRRSFDSFSLLSTLEICICILISIFIFLGAPNTWGSISYLSCQTGSSSTIVACYLTMSLYFWCYELKLQVNS